MSASVFRSKLLVSLNWLSVPFNLTVPTFGTVTQRPVTKPMQISEVTYNALRANGVDTSKLLTSLGSAQAKKATLSDDVRQGKAEFKQTLKEQVERHKLLDHEDYAMVVKAFDSANCRTAKTWGAFVWQLPDIMVQHCRQFWPYEATTLKKDNKQAAAATA